MNSLVSIVIPTYKRADMLENAINSCLNQTYSNIEVIVVNDNNKEDNFYQETVDFMKTIKSPKVRLVNIGKNVGGAKARNVGIENAKGEYVAFLDDDDEFVSEKIEKQLNFMNDGQFDATFTNNVIKKHDTLEIIKIKKYPRWEDYDSTLTFHLVEMIVGTQTFLVKKSVLDNIGGFTPSQAGQEYLLMLKIIENNYSVGYLDENFSIAYIHDRDRITTSRNKIKAEKFLLDIKRKYFNELTFSQRRQIKYVYHYNIFNYYKNRNLGMGLCYGILLLVSHPLLITRKVFDKLWGKK